jgi:8-amino-7-oxononanoate synthase
LSIQNRIQQILVARKEQQEYRKLSQLKGLIDFTSNDYLGWSKSEWIQKKVDESLMEFGALRGSTGSRLLSGNSYLIEQVEAKIAAFHNTEKALLFSSGFLANLGLISTLCRKGDIILFDDLVHASIHQGIQLSKANAYAFKHNNLAHLEELLEANSFNSEATIFVVVESVYSMDGDKAPLKEIVQLKEKYRFECIVDEAHALGVFGEKGRGICQLEGVEKECLARVYTFGKALGGHGAAIVGPVFLIDYLINFCKPFIYSTAPSIDFVKRVEHSYNYLLVNDNQQNRLTELIKYFNEKSKVVEKSVWLGAGPIFGLQMGSTTSARALALSLQEAGYDVRPIVYPTVARGSERIRICLHAFNTESEIDGLLLAINQSLNHE